MSLLSRLLGREEQQPTQPVAQQSTLRVTNNPAGTQGIGEDLQRATPRQRPQSGFTRGIQGQSYGRAPVQQQSYFTGNTLQQGGQAPQEDSWNTLGDYQQPLQQDPYQALRRILRF